MPSVITKPIFIKLAKKLKLQTVPQALFMSDYVTTTIDLDNYLGKLTGQATTSSAASRDDVYTVPSGKMWVVRNIHLNRVNAGVNTIYAIIDGTTRTIYQTAAAGTTEVNLNNMDLRLPEGMSIQTSFAAGTSGILNSHIIYDEFDAA